MKQWFIRRDSGFLRNVLMSIALSLVGSYVVMCLAWAVTGMRYNALVCLRFFAVSYLVLLPLTLGLSIHYLLSRRRRARAIRDHLWEKGWDEEYFRLLEEHLGEPEDGADMLRMAALSLEGKRFDKCREYIGRTDFKELDGRDQEEYFNLCLYCAVLEGNVELADEIYSSARRYFDRATVRSRGHIMHTVGAYCLMKGRTAEARNLFLDAWSIRDRGLRFECCAGLARCSLYEGRKEEAKELCIKSSGSARTRSHAEELRRLMIDIESAYRAQTS